MLLHEYKSCAVNKIFYQFEKDVVKQRPKLWTWEKWIDHIGRRDKHHLDVSCTISRDADVLPGINDSMIIILGITKYSQWYGEK